MGFAHRLQLLAAFSLGLALAGSAAAQPMDPDPAELSTPSPEQDAIATPATPEQEIAAAEAAGVVFVAVKASPVDTVNTSHTLSCDSKMASLLDNPQALSVLQRRIPDVVSSPQVAMARGLTLKQLSHFRQTRITPADLAAIDEELASASRP